jgi:hypothetical protein
MLYPELLKNFLVLGLTKIEEVVKVVVEALEL